jgi:hypothetical protein
VCGKLTVLHRSFSFDPSVSSHKQIHIRMKLLFCNRQMSSFICHEKRELLSCCHVIPHKKSRQCIFYVYVSMKEKVNFFIQNLARKTECLLHSVLVYYNSLTINLPDPFCREPSFPFFACFLMPQESIPCSQFAICTKLLIDVHCMSV